MRAPNCMKLKLDLQNQVKAASEYDRTPPPIPVRGYSISPTLGCHQMIGNTEGKYAHEIVEQNPDQSTERIYQPLIPPRRYDDAFKENSEYQSLSFDRTNRDVHEATQGDSEEGDSLRGAQISYTETKM